MSQPNIPVRFALAEHKNKGIIKIEFDYNQVLIQRVKVLPGAAWSQTMKCWYVPDTDMYRQRCKLERKTASPEVLLRISSENQQALSVYMTELKLKSYSYSTISTYRNEFAQLLQTLGTMPVKRLSRERLRDYFV